MGSFSRISSRLKLKPERFRTEQEKTEETEAPKAAVTVGVVFGGSPFRLTI